MRDRSAPDDERRLEAAAAASRVPPSRVRYFVRVGLVRPSRVEGHIPFFGEAEMARLRRIRRLRDDLGLNFAGIEVALRLLDEIESLRRELGKGSGESTVEVSGPRQSRPRSRPERTSTSIERDRGGSNGQL